MKAADQLLGERAARTFGQDQDFRFEIVAGFEIRLWLVLLVDTLVIGADAGNLAFFEQQLTAGKAGENGDAGLLNLRAEPLDEAIERDDIVAVIAQRRRGDREP